MPALWITASNEPRRLTCSATLRVCAILAQIADDDALRSRRGGHGFFAPLLATRVQDHAVPLFDKELGRHLAESVGGTCNKNACHNRLLSVLLEMHARPVKERGRKHEKDESVQAVPAGEGDPDDPRCP